VRKFQPLFLLIAIGPLLLGEQTPARSVLETHENTKYNPAPSQPFYLKTREGLEIPRVNAGEEITSYTGFSLCYDELHEQASWVAYELTASETNARYQRSNQFYVDPAIRTGTAENSDYKYSGYDRGHLAPAADMSWSIKAMKESFYYSNISPQTASFNRGIWSRLEKQIRTWAVEREAVYIVTGPILRVGLNTIGNNRVSIPDSFYKVVLDFSEPTIQGIGFIIPQSQSGGSIQAYAVPIEQVEQITGIDFFPLLPTDVQEKIERQNCIPCWSWDTQAPPSDRVNAKTSTSVQCSGLTKSGNRCKRMTKNPNGQCYQHGGH